MSRYIEKSIVRLGFLLRAFQDASPLRVTAPENPLAV
jgi:hypothetical protein